MSYENSSQRPNRTNGASHRLSYERSESLVAPSDPFTALSSLPYSGFGAALRGETEGAVDLPVPRSAFGDAVPMRAFTVPLPVSAFDGAHSGQRAVHIAQLTAHAASGFNYDLRGSNCILRWANTPQGYSGTLDVVVHFHGYKAHNAMRLADKARESGLDLTVPGVTRPTLGIVPHGHAFASRMQNVDGFDFPAINTRDELLRFIDSCLSAFRSANGGGQQLLTRGRVILTGHSGGGAALTRLMQRLGTSAEVHGFHYFDATYGGLSAIARDDGWLASALARDARAIEGLSSDAERTRHMLERGGHLRILFIDGTGTASAAKGVDAFVRRKLGELLPSEALRDFLYRYYRAQSVSNARVVNHGAVPRTFGGRLLADPAHDLGGEARELRPAAARAHALEAPAPEIAVNRPGQEPRYTLDRSGNVARAQGLLAYEDPLALASETRGVSVFALGYGTDWDSRIRSALGTFYQDFTEIPLRVGSTTIGVRPPYLMNVPNLTTCPNPPTNVTMARLCRARAHRAAAPAALRTLLAESRFRYALIGKSTPGEIRDFMQAAADQNLLQTDQGVRGAPTAEQCRQFLIKYGVGIDCSGFVAQALNRLVVLFANASPGDRIADIRNYGSSALKGPSQTFEVVANPRDLCGGDTMWRDKHIRIVTSVELRGDRIVFETIESLAGRGSIQAPGNVGPARAYWRLVPRPGAPAKPYANYVLERAESLTAPDSHWHADPAPHVFSHYRPLRRLLAAAGATPTSLALASGWFDAALDAPIERVRVAIEATLTAFERVRVAVQGSPVEVRVPYFINRRTSPSFRRAEQNRPGLLRNAELAAAYGALPRRAKEGKCTPPDVRTLLQRAIDGRLLPASAPPNASALNGLLSDLGVGIDCSGFVSQALNAAVEAVGGSERINTNSANLRGGSPGNTRQFDQVTRPRDLQPGDTMWKSGHIRIVRQVERQPDGSIHVTTAESSSVDLIGPRTRLWRCPNPDQFTGVEVRRGQRFVPNSETNVWSRYKALAAALGAGGATVSPRPALPAARRAPPPQGERPRSSNGQTGRSMPTVNTSPAPATVAQRVLSQADVSRLAAVTFGNTREIDAFFGRRGASGFIDWYNATLADRGPFAGKRIDATSTLRGHFAEFWNAIPVAFDRARITPLDFAGLMCININETGGNFGPRTETCGRGREDRTGARHAGLAYAFDRIVDDRPGRRRFSKRSYNTLRGNRRAGDLFNDADFRRAHGSLQPAARLGGHGHDFGGAWNSERYPADQGFPTDENLATNGFIMQADFYKFRGRGVIQTTGRGGYSGLIQYIQRYSGSNAVLNEYKQRWSGLTLDVAATISTNDDWDRIFAQGEIRAKGVAQHAARSDRNQMSTDAAVLNLVPTPTNADPNPRGTPHSIYHMGRRISGSYAYGSGIYRERVLAMLNAMLALL